MMGCLTVAVVGVNVCQTLGAQQTVARKVVVELGCRLPPLVLDCVVHDTHVRRVWWILYSVPILYGRAESVVLDLG